MKSNKTSGWLYRAHNLGLPYRVIVIIIFISLIATVTEIFGVGMFLPIFQFISFEGNIDALVTDSTIWKYLINVFDFFKIEPLFAHLLILSFSFFIGRQIFLYFRMVYIASIRQRIVYKIRNTIFNKYIKANTAYHDSIPVGNLVNVITTEANNAVIGIMAPLGLAVYLIMLCGYISVLLLLSWQMTIISIIVILISSLLPNIWIKKSANIGRKLVHANTMMTEFLVNRLRSPRLVRLSGTEIAEKNEFCGLTKKQRNYSIFASVLKSRTDIVMEPVVIGLSLVFLYFSYTVLELQIEVIGLYLVIALRVLPIVKSVISQWQRVQMFLGSIEIIEGRISDMEKSAESDTGVKVLNKLTNSVKFDNVSYRYPGYQNNVLKNITIEFKLNSVNAIVGPSGSGKSTLIDLLPCLRLPTNGVIQIDSINIGKYTIKSIRELMSYAPQSPQIFNGTVKSHILYGKKDATDDEIWEAINLAGAKNFINKLPQGIDTFFGEEAVKLSGGQRQRLDLARVLVRKSKIIILDEPTSNLDAESEEEFEKSLRRIHKETDATIIVVAHKLANIAYADNIIVLNQGKVESMGKHEELLGQKGWYSQAWDTQKTSAKIITN